MRDRAEGIRDLSHVPNQAAVQDACVWHEAFVHETIKQRCADPYIGGGLLATDPDRRQ